MNTDHLNKNIIQLDLVDGKIKKKEVKLTKNGDIKKTHSNKKMDISSEVYPLKNKNDITSIIECLNKKIICAVNNEKRQIAYRNKLLWIVGMNVGIRASDLRLLKWSFFFDVVNGEIVFKDFYAFKPQKTKKTGKYVKLYFNNTLKNAIVEYLSEYPVNDIDSYIFLGREGTPITVQQMWNVICDTAKDAGIKQNVGTHTLRKTWAYHCWHDAADKNKALVVLQKCFNHSSTQMTLAYIGIYDEEIEDMYMSVELGIGCNSVDNKYNAM